MKTISKIAVILISASIAITGCASLKEAAYDGNYERVKALLDNGEKVKDGCPLGLASLKGHKDIVKLLLDNGSDIEGKCGDRPPYTALYFALAGSHYEIANYLISKGASTETVRMTAEDNLIRYPNNDAAREARAVIALLGKLKSTAIKGNISSTGENTIFMNDGSEIRGEIMNQSRTNITVKTKYTTMTIEKKNIKEIKYK